MVVTIDNTPDILYCVTVQNCVLENQPGNPGGVTVSYYSTCNAADCCMSYRKFKRDV